jgi:hypothetical protein
LKALPFSKKDWSFLGMLVSVYLIILGVRGFLFASNDVMDVMAYAKYLQDNTLYPKDFYIQSIAHTLPNERIVFALFLSLWGSFLPWATLILHALSSLFLIAGIYRIAKLFLHTDFFAWLLPLVLFGPLYHIGVGDCELYYNMFIASLLAKSIGIWSLYYYLNSRYSLAYFLLLPVTLIHPTVGAQLFLIYLGVQIVQIFMHGKKIYSKGLIAYVLIGLSWLFFLQFRVFESSVLSTQELLDIFEFRLAHHFIPAYFKITDWLISIFFILLSLFYFWFKNHQAFWLVAVLSFGMILYTLSISLFPMEILLSSQWFKTYIWAELLGVIVLLRLVEKQFAARFQMDRWNRWFKILCYFAAIIILVLTHLDDNYFSAKRHDFFYKNEWSSEADIGRKAREYTKVDDLFIVPMEFTEFKYYSERSLYIDYKTVVHRKDALSEWYARIQRIYGIDVEDRREGSDLYSLGKQKYLLLDVSDLKSFRTLGIDYFVTYQGHVLDLEMLAKNKDYIIYKL